MPAPNICNFPYNASVSSVQRWVGPARAGRRTQAHIGFKRHCQLISSRMLKFSLRKTLFSTPNPIFLLQDAPSMSISQLTQGSGRSSGVEHNLAKVRVESSNLFAHSISAPSDQCCTKHISAIRAVSRRSLHQALRSAFGHSEARRPHHKISCDAPNRLCRTDYQSAFWPRTST